ncbi:MAG TPA: ion channel [Myxococcales bacterium]
MPARPPYFGDTESWAIVRGLKPRPFKDAYNLFLRARWPAVIGAIAGAFLVVNLLFALVYRALGGVAEARPGSLADAFYFSVETLATLGYGVMHPESTGAHLVVVVEVLIGTLLLALTTGLVFSKFSLPTARVLFTKEMVVSRRNGVPTLMFRLGNERGGRVFDVEIRLSVGLQEKTLEGEDIYRVVELSLQRGRVQSLARAWLGTHPITEASPLFGHTAESLKKADAEFLATVTGIEGTTAQPLLAAHSWVYDEVHFGMRFADMLIDLPDGRSMVDFTRFDDLIPAE